jgi:hypothetical protein
MTTGFGDRSQSRSSLARQEAEIEPDAAKSESAPLARPEDAPEQNGTRQVPVSRDKSRTVAENLLVFAVIPSLLIWTVLLLLLSGDYRGAVQVACTALAGGFVGWYLGETH